MTFASLKKAVNARKWPVLIVCLVLLVAAPIVIQHGLVLTVMIYIMLYSILSMGDMVILGYGGMLNMGHTAFYGVGAYVSALLALHTDLPFIACFLIAGIAAALFGFLLSVPCLRVSADFLGLIILAFLELFKAVVTNWTAVTRGPMGLVGIPSASLFGFEFNTQIRFYYLIFVVLILVYFILSRMMKAPFGRALQATRDDEIGARAVGIDVNRQKVYAFVVGAAVAGLAGSLFAHYVGFIAPNSFALDATLLITQMCILGGLGSLKGAIFGAAFFTIMPEIIRPLAEYRVGVGGVIMLLVILIRPQGVLGSRAFAGKGGIFGNLGRQLKRRQAALARRK